MSASAFALLKSARTWVPQVSLLRPGKAWTSRDRSVTLILKSIQTLLLAIALCFAAPDQGYYLNIFMQAATYAVGVLGLVVVLGYCGQINIAQAAFFGIGAYAVALGTVDYQLNFFVALAIGVAVSGAAGLRPGRER